MRYARVWALAIRAALASVLMVLVGVAGPRSIVSGPGSTSADGRAIVVDHTSIDLNKIPKEWIEKAKTTLRIAYGHSSHGSQLTTGMAGLVKFKGSLYAWKSGGGGGALDLRDFNGDFGRLGIAGDLGADATGKLDRTAWERATRAYLKTNPGVNVVIWSWCWQVYAKEEEIQLYLDLMSKLESDFPEIKFVYMTGHADGSPIKGEPWEIVTFLRNNQIRDYCRKNGKILYDFNDIECYDPDETYFGDKLVNDACEYDSNGDGVRDRNWAIDWQKAHPGEWYDCESVHSQPLNANMKAYAAWHLWARLAGWDGQ
jgi:hypothetical protein